MLESLILTGCSILLISYQTKLSLVNVFIHREHIKRSTAVAYPRLWVGWIQNKKFSLKFMLYLFSSWINDISAYATYNTLQYPLQKDKIFLKGSSWVWHKTISGGEAPVLELCWVSSTSLLPLLTRPFWQSVRVPSMGQLDLFENY